MRTDQPPIIDHRIIVIFSLPPLTRMPNAPAVRDVLLDIQELVDDLRRLGCLVTVKERT